MRNHNFLTKATTLVILFSAFFVLPITVLPITSWSGRLPNADSGEYAIRLISNYKVASYTPEVMLK